LSEVALSPEQFHRLRQRVLDLYAATILLMLVGIGVIILYSIVVVGPLTSPGAQESFGLGLALAFLMAAVAGHLVDRMYRVWPLGRRIHPTPPGTITPASEIRFFQVLVVVIAAGAIAYLIGALIAG
jgi:hypothetical protein